MPMTNGLPPPNQAALLLDLDGTLLDIAATPDAVRVEPGLAAALRSVRDTLQGALAIVTGRPIGQVDRLLPDIPYAVAGEHGGAIRPAPGSPTIRLALPDVPPQWFIDAALIAEAHPGAMLERKQRGFVLHYRAVPEHGPALQQAVSKLVDTHSAQFQIMPALMAWEVRPRGADKGTAVQTLMETAPFAGRIPIFIGDDVTDEDGMAAARRMGGAGLRVDAWFETADGVRRWLGASAEALTRGESWPALPYR